MHSPRAVARSMIERAEQLNLGVTNLKLQKLLYLAHGWLLAEHRRPLVKEPFQAWKYGPVLESLYHDLKVFGPAPITVRDGFVGQWERLPDGAQAEHQAIDAVLRQCGSMSGGELIDLSHDRRGPWHAVYEAGSRNIALENEKIAAYFKTIVAS